MFKKYQYITILFIVFNANLYCPGRAGHSSAVPAPVSAPVVTFTVTAVTWGGVDGKSVILNGSVLQYNGMSIRGDGSVVGLGVTTYNNQNNILAINGNVIQINNQVFQVPIFPAPQVEAPVDYSKMNITTFSSQIVPTGKDNRIKYATRAGELNKNLLISANNVISAINYNAPEDMIKDQLNQLKDAISKGSSYSFPVDKIVDSVSRLFDHVYPKLKLTDSVGADQLKKDVTKLKKNPTKEGLLKFVMDAQKIAPSFASKLKPPADIISGKATDDDYKKVADKIVNVSADPLAVIKKIIPGYMGGNFYIMSNDKLNASNRAGKMNETGESTTHISQDEANQLLNALKNYNGVFLFAYDNRRDGKILSAIYSSLDKDIILMYIDLGTYSSVYKSFGFDDSYSGHPALKDMFGKIYPFFKSNRPNDNTPPSSDINSFKAQLVH